jgi:hypothetical protein
MGGWDFALRDLRGRLECRPGVPVGRTARVSGITSAYQPGPSLHTSDDSPVLGFAHWALGMFSVQACRYGPESPLRQRHPARQRDGGCRVLLERSRPADQKDGRTHLAYKAEHAVDPETGAVVALTVQLADRGDTVSMTTTLAEAGCTVTELAGAGGTSGRGGTSGDGRRSRRGTGRGGQGVSQQAGARGPGPSIACLRTSRRCPCS